jgi:peptide/nickel transport system permease protein
VGLYITKRLLLLPLTLFFVVLANFVIINLAPGEPVFLIDMSAGGEARQQEGRAASGDERYLQFREFFGLTLPILLNTWPWTSREEVVNSLEQLVSKKDLHGSPLSAKVYNSLRIETGDRARFCLPHLVSIMNDSTLAQEVRKKAVFFFLRGATRFSHVGIHLSEEEKVENQATALSNLFLDRFTPLAYDSPQKLGATINELTGWYEVHKTELGASPSTTEKIKMLFFTTRFARYMGRVLSLDFGVLRNDSNRTVITEVVSRLKYSLTLSIIPMFVTFFLCTYFGLLMAIWKDSFFDRTINLIFLLFYATPVFVVAPFLIKSVALGHTYPFTDISFPLRGFTSEDSLYYQMTSWQRLGDVFRHITLPLVTILYGALAVESRLSRAIFLDTLNADFVRTAQAKGARPFALYVIHVGRNAAIPIVTSIAGSLGVILGGSVIIETIFDINGFGKFFYDAIINRDYNVMMFSALMGSALSLVGYLVADIAYMLLDPRVTLEAKIA